MESQPKRRRVRPGWRLVPHDVTFESPPSAASRTAPVASVHCERHDCACRVEDCSYCERFARIDVHEAGYTLLCRSQDDEV